MYFEATCTVLFPFQLICFLFSSPKLVLRDSGRKGIGIESIRCVLTAELAGFVKKQKGRFSLTRKGELVFSQGWNGESLTRHRRRGDIIGARLSGSWWRICAGWRRRITGWWGDGSSIGLPDTWDLIPLEIHTLHVGIVISHLEGPFVSKWPRSSPLASPLPAGRVIGLECFKGLTRARPHHDARSRRNRCTGS